MNIHVKIFVLNWNGGEVLIECLESVSKIKYDNFEIIVIDNASSDNSINNIHNKFSDIKVIALDNNYGYSKAYNKAFELTGYTNDDFFMLLNISFIIFLYLTIFTCTVQLLNNIINTISLTKCMI